VKFGKRVWAANSWKHSANVKIVALENMLYEKPKFHNSSFLVAYSWHPRQNT